MTKLSAQNSNLKQFALTDTKFAYKLTPELIEKAKERRTEWDKFKGHSIDKFDGPSGAFARLEDLEKHMDGLWETIREVIDALGTA